MFFRNKPLFVAGYEREKGCLGLWFTLALRFVAVIKLYKISLFSYNNDFYGLPEGKFFFENLCMVNRVFLPFPRKLFNILHQNISILEKYFFLRWSSFFVKSYHSYPITNNSYIASYLLTSKF